MLRIPHPRVVAIGEAMIEFAPVQGGLFARGFAGDTFNTAWHMKQLLSHRAGVSYFTRVGQDKLSQAFLAELAADGLDTSHIGQDAARTMGLYLIELDGVERSFHYWRGQSAARLLADDAEKLNDALRGAGLIHLSGITLAILSPDARRSLLAALAEARAHGAIVSFDPNHRPRLWASPDETRAAVSAMLAVTDIALPSFDDETAVWGDATPLDTIRRIRTHGVREVIVKDGARRVHFNAGDGDAVVDTPVVPDIRDTTGAGDAFNAGYLAARLLDLPPVRAIAVAQALAAEVIRHFGARAPKEALAGLAALG